MSESNENPAAPWVDPVGLFLSDPESHLSDILYIYFRHYKKRLVFDLLREALRAVENRPDPIVVADVGASMGFDLLYVTRRLRMAGNSILLSRLHLLFLEGDPRLRAEGETMWASAAKKEFPFEFREAFLTEPLPVKHGSVDFAICSEVVEHMEQPAELLNSIFAILKPGGCLVLTTDNSPSLPQLIRRIPRWLAGSYSRHYAPVVKETEIEGSFERKGKTTFIYGHISLKSTWEWEKIARQAGFDIARYGTYQSIRRGGAGCRPGVLAAYFLAGFLNSCLPRSLGRYCGDTTALLLKKPAGPSETTTQSMGGS